MSTELKDDLDFLSVLDPKRFSLQYYGDWPENERWSARVVMRDLREGSVSALTPKDAVNQLRARVEANDLKVDYSNY